mgnify:CR=1 FL=1|tara:strand:+ start:1132 stop:1686 length:555 start_codon:yes stop_codon:yes gene_type:complete
MGVGLLIGAAIAFILLISSLIGSIVLWKKGRKVFGGICGGIFLLCISIFFTNSIASFSFSKDDARKDLEYANIELNDDFEIIENKVTGMPERFQKTELLISIKDAQRIIDEIKKGEDFNISRTSNILWQERRDGERNKIVTTNYKYRDHFYREGYFRENNYVPIHIIVKFKEGSNILEYDRNED